MNISTDAAFYISSGMSATLGIASMKPHNFSEFGGVFNIVAVILVSFVLGLIAENITEKYKKKHSNEIGHSQ